MEWLQGLYQNVLSELLAEVILGIAIGILGYYFRRFVKRQKEIDRKQDRKLQEWKAELESRLKIRDIRLTYFEENRLKAFQQIRQHAQKARDDARLVDEPALIKDYDNWVEMLLKDFENILGLLHEHALLLDYFGTYQILHEFKNELLNYFLFARKLNPLKEDERNLLKKEFTKFAAIWEKLTEEIRFPREENNNLNMLVS